MDYIQNGLDDAISKKASTAHNSLGVAKSEIDRLELKNERMNNALLKIKNWADAYPLQVFPEPDLKKAAAVLKDAGLTLDAISASTMRHVLSGVRDIVDAGLK